MKELLTVVCNEKLRGHQLIIPEHFKEFQINSIAFGTIELPCNVSFHSSSHLSISKELYDELLLPYSGSIHVFTHERTLHLGPLIGIFTAGFTSSILRPIGERSIFFSKLLSTEKKVGAYMFLFGANHINWENGTMEGYMFTEAGWCKKTLPFPHVVYDRLPNRRSEKHRLLASTREKMQRDYAIPWFNPGFFNKWDIHQKLRIEERIVSYLPETTNDVSIESIERYLSKYPFVYLKPMNGSLGFGVYKIIYNREENMYYVRYKNNEQVNKLQRFLNLETLLSHIFKYREMSSYLLQQGIALIKVDDSFVDFRVHTNKDEKGEWVVSAMAAKVSGKGSITTHANNGGVIKTVAEIFSEKEEHATIVEKLEHASLLISSAIDTHLPGFIGEIGFDFGVDKENKVWLFEANSKPGRSIFHHPKLRNEDMLTRKLSIEYAVYLTEKMIKHPEGVFT
ncbi:Endospore coat-associated protein YheD [Bacillus sp. THAF10]|uniref:YheC/YheD family endospore coat-associated protein n=1 Tax=Bacillus sp. THAF10 TaxID=2587848 RepID=UPI00126882D8|nr:YheC/YheD family protein [Bacillus sp. THAF10]QFT88240.1 Endospore coat-associated protein YheD [Bacillus sp. THAF10]